MVHMRIIYAITASALIIISLIALVAYRSMQNPITYIRISKLCLNAPPNMHTDIYALNEGISCFRTDISLNQSESSSLKNLSYVGAEYLGILDYQTVGARISYNGCVSGCNWTLGDWNKSVLNSAVEYPEISEWEIYNEPLVGKFMSGYENGNATHYFMMIRSAYRIIKSKDPNALLSASEAPSSIPYNTYSMSINSTPKYGQMEHLNIVMLSLSMHILSHITILIRQHLLE